MDIEREARLNFKLQKWNVPFFFRMFFISCWWLARSGLALLLVRLDLRPLAARVHRGRTVDEVAKELDAPIRSKPADISTHALWKAACEESSERGSPTDTDQ